MNCRHKFTAVKPMAQTAMMSPTLMLRSALT